MKAFATESREECETFMTTIMTSSKDRHRMRGPPPYQLHQLKIHDGLVKVINALVFKFITSSSPGKTVGQHQKTITTRIKLYELCTVVTAPTFASSNCKYKYIITRQTHTYIHVQTTPFSLQQIQVQRSGSQRAERRSNQVACYAQWLFCI